MLHLLHVWLHTSYLLETHPANFNLVTAIRRQRGMQAIPEGEDLGVGSYQPQWTGLGLRTDGGMHWHAPGIAVK